jgi:hypothetical protein
VAHNASARWGADMQRLTQDAVSRFVAADADALYALVSDVPRMPEWSPEVTACSWIGGSSGPTVRARFLAKNKRRWLTWSNKPLVTVAEPGRAFAVSRTEPGGGTIGVAVRLRSGRRNRGDRVLPGGACGPAGPALVSAGPVRRPDLDDRFLEHGVSLTAEAGGECP